MNTYVYADNNSVNVKDSMGLFGEIDLGEWNCLYSNPTECFASHAYEDLEGAAKLTMKAVGVGTERRACEGYMKCVVRCSASVIGMEIASTGVVRKLESTAKMMAAKKAAAFIAGGGTISTAISGFQLVQCSWSCVKYE